jgi:hypothetical protein
MIHRFSILFIGLICGFSLALNGCERSRAAPTQSITQTMVVKPAGPVVKRIVFVGKEHACDCTRKTVEGSLATLQKALGTPAKVPMERLQIDTEAEKVRPYQQQKAILTLPAIYFLDDQNRVLDLLQGEVTEEQVQHALKGK